MQHAVRNPVAVLVLILLFMPAQRAAQLVRKKPSQSFETTQANTVAPQTRSMTVWQARKALITILQRNTSSMRFRPESVETSANCWLDLRTLGTISVGEYFTRKSRYTGSPMHYYYPLIDGIDADLRCLGRLGFKWDLSDDPQAREQAQAFADALNRLRAFARGERTLEEDAVWRGFPQKATAWRALAVKPPLAEQVRKHRILAEKYFSDKDLYGAIGEYEAGLAINPVWPEGHFNAALLCAELASYDDAIQHMRAYVELVPDGSDTQSARDQMVIWEAELKKLR